jgi:hypothetical protein
VLEGVIARARPAPVALLPVPSLAPSPEGALLAPRPRLALAGLGGGGAHLRAALTPRRPSLALTARLSAALALCARLAPALALCARLAAAIALPAGRRAA